jgi:hypothetical protein
MRHHISIPPLQAHRPGKPGGKGQKTSGGGGGGNKGYWVSLLQSEMQML